MNDFNAWQVSRQWFTFAALLGWRNNFFIRIISGSYPLAFGFDEQRQLGRIGLDGLLRLTIEQAVAQQLDLFFKINDLVFVDRALGQQLRKQLFERGRVVRRVIGH